MLVAIPLFGSRISPNFDYSKELLLIKIKGREILYRKKLSLENLSTFQRVQVLIKSGVNTLLCGGIEQSIRQRMKNLGIDVIWNRMGEAEVALREYLRERSAEEKDAS